MALIKTSSNEKALAFKSPGLHEDEEFMKTKEGGKYYRTIAR